MRRLPRSLLVFVLAIAWIAAPVQARGRRHVRAARRVPLASVACSLMPVVTHGDPVKRLPGGRRGKVVFGVMGSAAPEGTIPKELNRRLVRLGKTIAKRGGVVLTGACPGMPEVTARAAKAAGGYTAGISPAGSLAEHLNKFHSPTTALDAIQMTSAGPGMGFIAREKQNIQHSDILVFSGGRSGTLGEIVFAMQERKVIALLEDSTGVSAQAKAKILPYIGQGKAVVVSDRDPRRLIDKALAAHDLLRRERPTKEIPDTLARLSKRLGSSSVHMQRKPVLTDAMKKTHNVYAFFGTSSEMDRADRAKVRTLTKQIATDAMGGRKPLLVVPTRPGLPTTVAKLAHGLGVETVGISPSWTRKKHHQAKQNSDGLDVVRLTGEGNRGIGQLASYRHAIQNADVVFVAGGDHRTLGGTIFAMYQPTVVAVLETKGMTSALRQKILTTYDKPATAQMIFDSDPKRLYQRAREAAAMARDKVKTQYIAPE